MRPGENCVSSNTSNSSNSTEISYSVSQNSLRIQQKNLFLKAQTPLGHTVWIVNSKSCRKKRDKNAKSILIRLGKCKMKKQK